MRAVFFAAILMSACCLCTHMPPPQFEVASIKPKESPERSATWNVDSSGHFAGTNIPIKFLMMTAYGLKESQLSGVPGWADGEKYDIQAKGEGAPSEVQLFAMLQSLLADRFKLRF